MGRHYARQSDRAEHDGRVCAAEAEAVGHRRRQPGPVDALGHERCVTQVGIRSIAVDRCGNVVITGQFMDFTTFGTTSLTSQGGRDVYVAKLDTDGNWQWAISAGGADWDQGYAITIDAHSVIYVTGYFDESAMFGNTTLITEGEYDVFISKLSDGFENQPPVEENTRPSSDAFQVEFSREALQLRAQEEREQELRAEERRPNEEAPAPEAEPPAPEPPTPENATYNISGEITG